MLRDASPTDLPSVVELFDACEQRQPGAVAVRFLPSSTDAREAREWTYRQVGEVAERAARELTLLGARPGALVGVFTDHCAEASVAALAALKAGAAYLPLNAAHPPHRLMAVLRAARPLAILVPPHLAACPKLEALVTDCRVPVLRLSLSDAGAGAGAVATAGAARASGRDVAYCLFTSGSTGEPKGVCMEHGCLANLIAWHVAARPPAASMLQYAPLDFDISAHEVFLTWATGGALVVVSGGVRANPLALLAALELHGVERAYLPFTPLSLLAQAACATGLFPSRLTQVITAGEPLRVTAALRRFFAATGAALFHHYGMTECQDVTALELPPDPAGWPALPSVGRAIAGHELFVEDEEGRLATQGTGMLCVCGPGLARGYMQRSGDEGRAAFRCLPNGRRVYRTGDLAELAADGEARILGRLDTMVKVNGYRVDTAEVEAALGAWHGVEDAAVVVDREPADAPEASAGAGAREGHDRTGAAAVLRACVVLSDASELASAGAPVEALRQHLAARLPRYMVPATFHFLPRFPPTANGKLDRAALLRQVRAALSPAAAAAVAGPPQQAEGRGNGPSVPALTAELVAARLVALIEQCTGRMPPPAASFFSLGLDSLAFATVAAALCRELGAPVVHAVDFYAHPSVDALVPRILSSAREACGGGPADEVHALPADVVGSDGWVRVLPTQAEALQLYGSLGNKASLHNYSVFRLRGPCSSPALRAAFRVLAQRHEALRTQYRWVDGWPCQRVLVAGGVDFRDAAVCSQADPRAAAAALLQHACDAPFDLGSGVVLRAALVGLAADDHALAVVSHQIATDGASLGPLFEELWDCYSALARGQVAAAHSSSRRTWAQYVAWSHCRLRGAEGRRLRDYWLAQLHDRPPACWPLATDKPRPTRTAHWSKAVYFEVAGELTTRLRDAARLHGCTLSTLLLASFAIVQSVRSGASDLLIACNVMNRPDHRYADVIGRTSDDVVIRARADASHTLLQAVQHVHAAMAGALAHQGYPMKLLADALGLATDGAGFRPLCQTWFLMLPRELFRGSAAALGTEAHPPLPVGPGLYLEQSDLVPREATCWFDLDLAVAEAEHRLDASLAYNVDLFEHETAQRIVAQLLGVLDAVCRDPGMRLEELGLV